MKRSVLALSLVLALSPTLRAAEPVPEAGRPVEICFVLDTTGSMSGLIEGAKQKIWSIANDVITRKPKPQSIRIALVGYRDRGDDYVTKVFDLTDDIDTVYKNLQTFSAAGGGDGPESVNQAMDEAVTKVAWTNKDDVLKIIFLVGDAPPHMDYGDDVKYPDVCQKAVKKNLIVNAVQCGTLGETTPIWQQIAKLGEGAFVQLGQTGDMAVIATPQDKELAELNRQIGKTLVPYGVDGPLRREAAATQAAKQMASEAAAPAAMADRLTFNSNTGKTVQGDDELIDAIEAKRVALKDLKDDQLPEDWRPLSAADREAKLAKLMAERAAIRAKIVDLGKQREAFIAEEKRKQAEAGKADSFDATVSKIINEQAARKPAPR